MNEAKSFSERLHSQSAEGFFFLLLLSAGEEQQQLLSLPLFNFHSVPPLPSPLTL